ncbi:hypothetical protein DNTS_025537 [Danionella cerebrum]|uniref:Uncharacterized protein n=1 Tax=Danionella cerebrum TaxID=2873325 RepID=A0A553MY52_9TELE|nr:hypothetical protein DNTS_025537 [Danionella translucida]
MKRLLLLLTCAVLVSSLAIREKNRKRTILEEMVTDLEAAINHERDHEEAKEKVIFLVKLKGNRSGLGCKHEYFCLAEQELLRNVSRVAGPRFNPLREDKTLMRNLKMYNKQFEKTCAEELKRKNSAEEEREEIPLKDFLQPQVCAASPLDPTAPDLPHAPRDLFDLICWTGIQGCLCEVRRVRLRFLCGNRIPHSEMLRAPDGDWTVLWSSPVTGTNLWQRKSRGVPPWEREPGQVSYQGNRDGGMMPRARGDCYQDLMQILSGAGVINNAAESRCLARDQLQDAFQ